MEAVGQLIELSIPTTKAGRQEGGPISWSGRQLDLGWTWRGGASRLHAELRTLATASKSNLIWASCSCSPGTGIG